MTPAFLGQIDIFAFGSIPAGWMPCEGQLLSIAQNQALYSLLATTYGGDGRTTFALPDLRGRVPISFGPDFAIGQRGGEEAHTLTDAEMPAHQHNLMADATTSATGNKPSSAAVLGQSSGRVDPTGPTFSANIYASGNPNAALAAAAIAPIAEAGRRTKIACRFWRSISASASITPPSFRRAVERAGQQRKPRIGWA